MMVAKRSSLFGTSPAKPPETTVDVDDADPAAPAPALLATRAVEPAPSRYPKAKTREGKRVATVYLEREALRQLQKIAFDEEVTIQTLLVEGVNAVFERRRLSRIA